MVKKKKRRRTRGIRENYHSTRCGQNQSPRIIIIVVFVRKFSSHTKTFFSECTKWKKIRCWFRSFVHIGHAWRYTISMPVLRTLHTDRNTNNNTHTQKNRYTAKRSWKLKSNTIKVRLTGSQFWWHNSSANRMNDKSIRRNVIVHEKSKVDSQRQVQRRRKKEWRIKWAKKRRRKWIFGAQTIIKYFLVAIFFLSIR